MLNDITTDEVRAEIINNALITNRFSEDRTVIDELIRYSVFDPTFSSIAAIHHDAATQSTNDIEEQAIQIPTTPINDIESSGYSNFRLACVISVLPPMIFSFFGALGCYALRSVGVDVGAGEPMYVFESSIVGGILLSPALYVFYLIIKSQKENCSSLYERATEESAFFRQVTDMDNTISASFAFLLVYSLSLGHSITAAIIGELITENLPYSKHETTLSQVILTIILGSGIYITYGALLIACSIQCYSYEPQVDDAELRARLL